MSNPTSIYSIGYKAGILSRQLIPGRDFSISSIPHRYYAWWMNLFEQDPIHVAVETVLIAFIMYILVFYRWKKDWKKDMRETLTEAEKQEIIQEWMANRTSLGRELTPQEKRKISDEHRIVVHEVRGSKVVITDFSQMNNSNKKNMNPTPSSSSLTDTSSNGRTSAASTPPSTPPAATTAIPTKTMLNMASHDFLGMGSDPDIKNVSRETLQKYGCGACGPRGFYGTIDVHMELEDEMARFFQTESAILYSDAASATCSSLATFAKRGDVLVVDDGIYESLQTGVTLSRSNVHFFKHNDMVSAGFFILILHKYTFDIIR